MTCRVLPKNFLVKRGSCLGPPLHNTTLHITSKGHLMSHTELTPQVTLALTPLRVLGKPCTHLQHPAHRLQLEMCKDPQRFTSDTYYRGPVHRNFAHCGTRRAGHAMHGIQWLADVDIKIRTGIRGAVLTFIICFIATSAMDERGQVNH